MTEILCPLPPAPDDVKKLVNSTEPNSSGRRKKRAASDSKVEIVVKLDGIESTFTITYFQDPTINKFGDRVHLYSTDTQELTISVWFYNQVENNFSLVDSIYFFIITRKVIVFQFQVI